MKIEDILLDPPAESKTALVLADALVERLANLGYRGVLVRPHTTAVAIFYRGRNCAFAPALKGGWRSTRNGDDHTWPTLVEAITNSLGPPEPPLPVPNTHTVGTFCREAGYKKATVATSPDGIRVEWQDRGVSIYPSPADWAWHTDGDSGVTETWAEAIVEALGNPE